MEYKLDRIKSPDDPNRCQAVRTTKGQCQNIVVPGSKYCAQHGGYTAEQQRIKESKKMYNVARWQQRIEQFGEHKDFKSLKSEIGVTRLLLEERLNKCTDSTDLIIHSGPILNLTEQLRKLIESCNKIDRTTGQLLDRKTLLGYASTVIDIISEEISDIPNFDKVADRIANRMIEALQNDNNEY
jgi:hypothetical protein